MKKLQLILFISVSFLTDIQAQVKINGVPSSTIATEAPFMDASVFPVSNQSGKGLLFPRTDLTQFTFKTATTNALLFPTAYDGMIVYNIASGPTKSGIQVNVTPGFYYFSNPGSGYNSSTGTWIRISNGSDNGLLSGTIDPSSINGNNGDFYINTTNNTLFGPKAGGNWPTGISLIGAQGPIGLTGATGSTGATGPAGTNGTNGQNTLVKTTTEAVGANCTTGGVKLEYGLDANSNGLLDVAEINATLTKYVCNGANGATGSTGPQGPIGNTGAAGVAGPQGVQGATGTAGTNGTNGKNTLAKTTTELAGANCTTGGVKLEYGIDANANGLLDVAEINATLTKYVCNGEQGAAGPSGSQNAWSLTGNSGTNSTTNYIGTTDAQNLIIKTNNTERVSVTSTGNVGVGTAVPTTKLQVNGAATNSLAFDAGSGTTIDFAKSNLAYTTAIASAYVLSNIKNGGAYSLILTGTTNTGVATFTSTGFTFKYMGTGARTTGKTHIYSFIVAGTNVYVSMATEN